jgi:hypothetical protein
MPAASKPTVQEAWANVMAEVRELGKGDRNAQQGFNFRGVDATMNAVGPALRNHGVSVVPVAVTELRNSEYTTKGGTVMRDVMLVVSYAINGPAGDSMPGAAAGEASDAGDKATPKAMSVAYRTFLLQSLCLPTQEVDPDAESYQRGGGPSDEEREAQEKAQAYANGLAGCTDPGVLEAKRAEAEAAGLLGKTVTYLGQQGILAGAFGHRITQLQSEVPAA